MKQNKMFKKMFLNFILLVLTFQIALAGIPTSPDFIYNGTETVTPKPTVYLNTSGGSFTTLVLNATAQNYKWKAYVGNATGALSLKDQDNFSIYDWKLSTMSGNVFVSRNESVDWTNLSCANRTIITNEDSYLNINSQNIDSVNRTFNSSIHKQFYAASKQINGDQCPAIATYINGSEQISGQNNLFQEILLQDIKGNMIYTTILENTVAGFDNNFYDFQMIVAEDETAQAATPYYFYLELI